MFDRRTLLQGGLGAAAFGVLARYGWPRAAARQGLADAFLPPDPSAPIAHLPLAPTSFDVGGLPFAKWFTGDDFQNREIPFHGDRSCTPPAPTEEIDVAVVGGGLSGLATAWLLRDHHPVVFELRQRFGGVAQGEHWAGTTHSLGNAYVITPDSGSFLEGLYTELGLPEAVRVDEGEFYVERNGRILKNYFDAVGEPPDVVAAFERYREVVLNMAENDYPDIPLPDGDHRWILDLDRKTLRQDIEEQMGMPVPESLAAAIQAYCYSSFAAGWEEISAASGWNFLAAEEYGRWVTPGGNSFFVQMLWQRLRHLGGGTVGATTPNALRNGCRVVDVRLVPGGRAQVSYVGADGVCRSLLAKRVVMSCPKFLCPQVIHDLHALDPGKRDAIDRLDYRAYVVANVLLDTPIPSEFYDVFLLGDGPFPSDQTEAQAQSRVVDLLSGHFARPSDNGRSVLTLYWPLCFDDGRWTLYIDDSFRVYAASLVPQIESMLALLGLDPSHVRQVRLTRWGHAVPVSRPNLIADGVTERVRRPIDERLFFVHQDNWALPAVENCLLDAEIFAPQVAAGL